MAGTEPSPAGGRIEPAPAGPHAARVPTDPGDTAAGAAVKALVGLLGSAPPDAVRAVTAAIRRFPPPLREAAARAAAWLHATGHRPTAGRVEALLSLAMPPAEDAGTGVRGLLAPRLAALAARLEAAAQAAEATEAAAHPVKPAGPSPAELAALAARLRDWGWRPGDPEVPETLEDVLEEVLTAIARGTRPAHAEEAGRLAEEARLILRTVRDAQRPDLAAPHVVPLPVPLPQLGGEVLLVRQRQSRPGLARQPADPAEEEVELYLNTPHLGSLRLTVRGGDTVSVTATAADPQARDALAAALPELARALFERGIRPGRLEAALGNADPPPFPPVPMSDVPGRLDRRI